MMKHRWIALAACGALVVVAGCQKKEESAEPAAEETQPAQPAKDEAAKVEQPEAAKAGDELTAEKSVTVPASPADLWAFVGKFDAVVNIAPVVTNVKVEGKGVGALRSFEAGGAKFVEKLEALDDGKSYTYSFVETPLPVQDYRGTISVADAGDGMSTFTWKGTFKVKGVPDEDAKKTVEGIYAGGVAAVQKKFPAKK